MKTTTLAITAAMAAGTVAHAQDADCNVNGIPDATEVAQASSTIATPTASRMPASTRELSSPHLRRRSCAGVADRSRGPSSAPESPLTRARMCASQ